MGIILFLAILFGLFNLGMFRTIAVILASILSAAIMLLAFAAGIAVTFFIQPDTLRAIQISDGWVSLILASNFFDSNFWIIFFLPFVFVANIFYWFFEVSFLQMNVILIIFFLIGLFTVLRGWFMFFQAYFAERQAG